MKLGPVRTTTKNRVWCLQKSIWKCCSYQFSIFVTLFTLEAHERFHVTKNDWSRSQSKVTRQEIGVTKKFCGWKKLLALEMASC